RPPGPACAAQVKGPVVGVGQAEGRSRHPRRFPRAVGSGPRGTTRCRSSPWLWFADESLPDAVALLEHLEVPFEPAHSVRTWTPRTSAGREVGHERTLSGRAETSGVAKGQAAYLSACRW